MRKIKPGKITAGTVDNNSKGTIERFVASENAFSFMNSVKKHLYTGNSFIWFTSCGHEIRDTKCFLTFSSAELVGRWEELI